MLHKKPLHEEPMDAGALDPQSRMHLNDVLKAIKTSGRIPTLRNLNCPRVPFQLRLWLYDSSPYARKKIDDEICRHTRALGKKQFLDDIENSIANSSETVLSEIDRILKGIAPSITTSTGAIEVFDGARLRTISANVVKGYRSRQDARELEAKHKREQAALQAGQEELARKAAAREAEKMRSQPGKISRKPSASSSVKTPPGPAVPLRTTAQLPTPNLQPKPTGTKYTIAPANLQVQQKSPAAVSAQSPVPKPRESATKSDTHQASQITSAPASAVQQAPIPQGLRIKDPNIKPIPFAFNTEEANILNALTPSDLAYANRILNGFDSASSPSIYAAIVAAKADYKTYMKFIGRNPQLVPLFKRKMLAKVRASGAQELFSWRIGSMEKWLADAINRRRMHFVFWALSFHKDGKSELGMFPLEVAIERKYGLATAAIPAFIDYQRPAWKNSFERARIKWMRTASGKEFLTGYEPGRLDGATLAACAQRFTDMQLGLIAWIPGIPTDISIAAAMSREYGVDIPPVLILKHRRLLEKSDEGKAQLARIDEAKQLRVSSDAQTQLGSEEMLSQRKVSTLSPRLLAAKHQRLVEAFAQAARESGATTLKELERATGTSEDGFSHLRENHPENFGALVRSLEEEKRKLQQLVREHSQEIGQHLGKILRFVQAIANAESIFSNIFRTSPTYLPLAARAAKSCNPTLLEKLFSRADIKGMYAFSAALGICDLLPFRGRDAICDTSRQQFMQHAAAAKNAKYSVSAQLGSAHIITIIHPFICDAKEALAAINSLPAGGCVYLFSCVWDICGVAVSIPGFSIEPKICSENFGQPFLVLKKSAGAAPLEEIPMPFEKKFQLPFLRGKKDQNHLLAQFRLPAAPKPSSTGVELYKRKLTIYGRTISVPAKIRH